MSPKSKYPGALLSFVAGFAVLLLPWAFTASFDALSSSAEAATLEEQTFNWDDGRDPSARKSAIMKGENQLPSLGPGTEQAMLEAIARYQIVVRRGGWPVIPGGRMLVPGSRDRRVELLVHRLMISGDLVPPPNFDATRFNEVVQRAVIKFQVRHGLLPHGKVDEKTRRALNVPASARLEALETNLPRARTYAEGLSGRYVVVNVPAAELEAVEDGYLHSRHVTVVGKVDRPTPEVSSEIVQVNFNPYWHAPISIAEKDIIPQLQKGLSYLHQINMRVFEGGYYGTEVDPSTVDWSTASPKKFYFRQEPGESNAMASVRINFPNAHDVYLHDTPAKGMFSQAVRYDSSGCVRVDDVQTLVTWLLNGQDDWSAERVAELGENRERTDIELSNKVGLRLVYLTAWAVADGSVHFRPDVYGRDVMAGQEAATDQPDIPAVAAVQSPQPETGDTSEPVVNQEVR